MPFAHARDGRIVESLRKIRRRRAGKRQVHELLRMRCRMAGKNEAERPATIASAVGAPAELNECLNAHHPQNSVASLRGKPPYGFTPMRMLNGQLIRRNSSGLPHR